MGMRAGPRELALVLCKDPDAGDYRHRELEVRESEGGVEVFVPCAAGGDVSGHWLAPAPATLRSKAELVLISRPHYWPGRFAALLAKARWTEREAARYQQTIADDETARLARAGIALAALDGPPA